MTKHLNEEQLIKYQFDLADGERAAEMKAHLDGCDSCRGELERLRGKFSSLELLRDAGGIEVSDDLIERTVSAASASKSGRSIRFGSPVWSAVGVIAAMILVVLFLRSSDFDGGEELTAPSDTRPAVMKEEKVAIRSRARTDMQMAKPKAKKKLAPAPRKMLVAMDTTDSDDMQADFETDAIADVPPFAPASAIELVTLPRREGVEITIYNSADLTLVREKRNLTLKRGWNWLQFMWANTKIDPTSLSLEATTNRSKIDIQQLVYPAGLKDIGRWLIRSEVEGQFPFEITYFTSGVGWRAFYEGTLAEDEQTMKLKGFVRVTNNSGEVYEDAKTRLIVGKVHILDQIAQLASRQYPYDRPGLVEEEDGDILLRVNENERIGYGWNMPVAKNSFVDFDRPKEIKKEGLSEYFLYTIEGTETIKNGWAKRLGSFEADDVPVESLYKYDEERYGTATMRYVSFVNDEEHELGETPIPNGDVRIFRANDAAGYLSYVGRSNAKYIPVNEEVELPMGVATNVKVEPVLMNFATENHQYDDKGNISGWDEVRQWKITVTNTRLLPVDIEITRAFGTAYWDIDVDDDDVTAKKHDATHERFELNVEPRSKKVLNYTIRTYHGTREEAWKK